MLQLRRYQPEDNEIIKALHYAGLKQFGADADPFYDSDLNEIEHVNINNNGDFLVGLYENEIVAMGAIRKFSEICGEIKEKHNFIISPLVLAAEQFKQMSCMGLYSGKEKVLFKKG